MKHLLALSLALCVSAMYGCATTVRSTTEVLVIESEPPGARVEIQPANRQCTTPCSVTLKRMAMQMVSIRRDGYEAVVVNVTPQTSGAGAAGMAGNVVSGGIFGALLDSSSGATKDLKPNPIKVKLVALVAE